MSLVIFVIPVLHSYLLKHKTTWNNLKQPTRSKKQSETTWNNLQQARNSLKRPTACKKWLETTNSEQETAWNDLKQLRTSKKLPERTYHEQMTWSNLQQARNDLKRTDSKIMEPLYLKNNQLEGCNVRKKQ